MKPTLVGWFIFLMALVLINKNKTGHTLIYWTLMTILVFLLIGNYQRIMPAIMKEE